MYKKGGRIKFLARGASKYTPPPPSPEKCFMARYGGRGGGVYNFALDLIFRVTDPKIALTLTPSNCFGINFDVMVNLQV